MDISLRVLACSICVVVMFSVIGTTIGFFISSGDSVSPASTPTPAPSNSISGQSPELAIGESWTVLDFGEGNITQVTITVDTNGFINVKAYEAGGLYERRQIYEHGTVTFPCYKIEFQNDFSYEYDDKKIVFYNYHVVT